MDNYTNHRAQPVRDWLPQGWREMHLDPQVVTHAGGRIIVASVNGDPAHAALSPSRREETRRLRTLSLTPHGDPA